MDSFDFLIEKGFDPMIIDNEGNTVLHMFAFGDIRDIEYDFIKNIC